MDNIEGIVTGVLQRDPHAIGRAISIVEDGDRRAGAILQRIDEKGITNATVLGITGPIGVGKSTIINQLITYYRKQGHRIGIVAIDPSSPLSGGAILGDRIRMMGHSTDHDVVIRSMATRGRKGGVCAAAGAAVRIMMCSGCNPVIIETAGIGQTEIDVIGLADITVLVLAPGYGDDIQVMKAGLIEVADILAVNKMDCPGADAFVMELESVARGRDCTVCQLIAPHVYGIENLANTIMEIDGRRRRSGQFLQDRQKAWEAEVMDWAVEMMRAKLKKYLSGHFGQLTGDPRAVASKLVGEIRISVPDVCVENRTEVFS